MSAGIRSLLSDDENRPHPQPVDESVVASTTEASPEQEEGESALVATSEAMERAEETGLVERRSMEARLPVQLDVGIPIRDFRLKNLLVLEPGSLIESQWAPGEDVPISSGEVQVAWSEFEVVDTQLAVRLTRLA
jgi:flagellar motor switch/type III secretory pathway protein FliN